MFSEGTSLVILAQDKIEGIIKDILEIMTLNVFNTIIPKILQNFESFNPLHLDIPVFTQSQKCFEYPSKIYMSLA